MEGGDFRKDMLTGLETADSVVGVGGTIGGQEHGFDIRGEETVGIVGRQGAGVHFGKPVAHVLIEITPGNDVEVQRAQAVVERETAAQSPDAQLDPPIGFEDAFHARMTPVINGCRLLLAAFFNATCPKNVNLFSVIVDILIPIFFLGGAAGPSAAFFFSQGVRGASPATRFHFDFWTAAVHCRFG